MENGLLRTFYVICYLSMVCTSNELHDVGTQSRLPPANLTEEELQTKLNYKQTIRKLI